MTIGSSVTKATLFPEELIAAILLSTSGNISDLSQKLTELKERGIDIGFIALRRAPDGVYSEDIDQYISYLLTFDYVRERSPTVTLSEKGRNLCAKVVKNAYQRNPDAVGKMAEILNLDIKKLIRSS